MESTFQTYYKSNLILKLLSLKKEEQLSIQEDIWFKTFVKDVNFVRLFREKHERSTISRELKDLLKALVAAAFII